MLIKKILTMYRATDAPLKNPICKVFTSTIKKIIIISIKLKAPPGAENFS